MRRVLAASALFLIVCGYAAPVLATETEPQEQTATETVGYSAGGGLVGAGSALGIVVMILRKLDASNREATERNSERIAKLEAAQSETDKLLAVLRYAHKTEKGTSL